MGKLVLSRKQDEKVFIINRATGERIKVDIVDIVGGNRVQIGINASQDWHIIRNELEEKEPRNVEAQESPTAVKGREGIKGKGIPKLHSDPPRADDRYSIPITKSDQSRNGES